MGTNELSRIDRLAKFLNTIYNGEVENDRVYGGVYSIPYNKYTEKAAENDGNTVDAYCDVIIDNKPHVYSWRFWGKRAEVIIEFLDKDASNEKVVLIANTISN